MALERTHTRRGKKNDMIQYGITSLTPECASTARFLALRRGHWAIENLSHHTRDMLLVKMRLKCDVEA